MDSDVERRAAFILELRERGVSDRRVLSAMEQIPREAFVESDLKDLALADNALPIACGQTISQPYIVAFMTEKLDVSPEHRVLEIGTGSGYQAAILARLAKHVVSIERYKTLADQARALLDALGIDNVEVQVGDGALGVSGTERFDRIMVTAAADKVPQALVNQLAPGGVMMIPIGPEGAVQTLMRVERTDTGVHSQELLPVRFVPLVTGIARHL